MSRLHPMLGRVLVVAVTVAALAIAVAACGSSSSSSSSSTGSASEGEAETSSVAEEAGDEESEGEEAEESPEAELENIMLIEIFGKFGGNSHEYDLVEGGTCKIVKVNVTAAAVKADPKAILDHEKNASVEVAPLKPPATMRHCREAAESAIG